MSFCEGVSVCPRCGGMHASESTQVSRDLREQQRQTQDLHHQPVMGLFGTALRLLGTPNQSMRNTADDIRGTPRTQRTVVSDMSRRPLEDLAEVRRIIESSNRSNEDKQRFMASTINQCPNEEVRKWLEKHSPDIVVFELVDMYYFLIEEIEKKMKKKEIDSREIDIIFVAHGGINSFMFPADCFMPLPSITDVVLYSPWNCGINADVAYGVATGSIEPRHRRFFCMPEQAGPHPDDHHQPTNLPNRWNSMSEAGRSKIPNICLSPLREPQDPAWNDYMFLQDRLGEPGRNRILIPFTRQGWMGSHKEIPFVVVTLVLSVVLKAYECRFPHGLKATVHLAACLNRSEYLDADELKQQYGITFDNTIMGSSEERISNVRNNPLYKAFKDMFG